MKDGFYNKKEKKRIDLKELIERSENKYKWSEWEFPKGRRNHNETNKETADREFREETNYEKDDYNLLENITVFTENYRSNNNVNYRHIYYIGHLINREKIVKVDKNKKEQSSEIKDIKWVTKREALNKIRDYQGYRRDIIEKIFILIEEIENKKYMVISLLMK